MKISEILNRSYRQLFLVFALAYIVRIVYIFSIRELPTFYSLLLDSQVHDEWAREILFRDFWGNAAFFRAPLYAYFLASVYAVFGTNILIARIIQAVIGSFSCVLIYMLAFKIFRQKTVALLAGICSSLYWMFIYFDVELLIPVLIIFLDLCGFILLLEAVEFNSRRCLFYSSLFFGFSAIARPNVLLFMPAAFFWILFVQKKKSGLLNALKFCGLFTFGVCLVVFAVTVRNYLIGDDFVLIGSQGGMNFYIGNNPYSDGKSAILPGAKGTFWGGYHDSNMIAMNEMNRSLLPSEICDYWYKKGIQFITGNPAQALRLFLVKISHLFDVTEISNNKNLYFFKDQSWVLRIPVLFSLSLVLPLSICGLILAEKNSFWYLMVSFLAIYSLSIVLFFVTSRFRMPLVPVLIIYAAYAIWAIFRSIRTRSVKIALESVAFVILVSVLLAMNATPKCDTASPNDGHFSMANAYYMTRQFDKALELVKKTLTLGPLYSSRSYMLMGYILLQKNSLPEGKDSLRRALEIDETLIDEINSVLLVNDYPELAFELTGKIKRLSGNIVHREFLKIADHCMAQKKYSEAEKCYKAALVVNRAGLKAMLNLAGIQSVVNHDQSSSLQTLSQANTIFPDHPLVLQQMRLYYQRNSMTPEAEKISEKLQQIRLEAGKKKGRSFDTPRSDWGKKF